MCTQHPAPYTVHRACTQYACSGGGTLVLPGETVSSTAALYEPRDTPPGRENTNIRLPAHWLSLHACWRPYWRGSCGAKRAHWKWINRPTQDSLFPNADFKRRQIWPKKIGIMPQVVFALGFKSEKSHYFSKQTWKYENVSDILDDLDDARPVQNLQRLEEDREKPSNSHTPYYLLA